MTDEKKKKESESLTFKLPDKLHQEFKIALVKRRTNQSEVLRDFITKYVAEANAPVVY